MKLKMFARLGSFASLAFLLAAVAVSPARAQEEGVPTVVDEVVAQVNDQVITLSMLRAEMKEAETLLRQRGMTEQQAAEEVARNQPRLIASLVNEQLLMQKGKEMPRLTEEVEAEVNREMLRVAKEQNIKTLEELEAALRANQMDPAAIRQTLRTQFMRQAVLQREVDAKIYFGLTGDELKKYYEANRTKFVKPESVELSEIYLSLAGKSEEEVRARAAQLVAQTRAAADFAALAATHSEREQNGERVAAQTKGKVGRFQVPDLRAEVAAAIKNLKAGGVTDPIRLDEGYQIIRVDERTPAADSIYIEEQVRGALTQERAEKERETYINNLRKEAYINVADAYKAAVMPLLQNKDEKVDAQKTASKSAAPAAADKKSTDKKP